MTHKNCPQHHHRRASSYKLWWVTQNSDIGHRECDDLLDCGSRREHSPNLNTVRVVSGAPWTTRASVGGNFRERPAYYLSSLSVLKGYRISGDVPAALFELHIEIVGDLPFHRGWPSGAARSS